MRTFSLPTTYYFGVLEDFQSSACGKPRIRVLLATVETSGSAIAWQMLHALKGCNLLFDFGALPRLSYQTETHLSD